MTKPSVAFRRGRLFLRVFLSPLALTCATACGQGSPAPADVSPDTWATVDGRTISKDDVDKAFRRTQEAAKTPSELAALSAKLALLDELITQDILLAKATALKIEVPQTELDTAYNNAKGNMPDEAFQQELTRRSLTPADMREGLRRELVVQKVVEQEIGSKVDVSEQEITDSFNANRTQFNVAEESYHLAQIVITPVREPQPTNSKADDATTPQEAMAKAQRLVESLKAGARFRELAEQYSEDAETSSRGGDLGLIPVSKIKQAPPPMRDAVLGKAPGSLSVASVNGGQTLVFVVAHALPGQRDLSMPEVRASVTNAVRAQKEQLLRVAYLTAARTDADVVNYLARRLVEAKGQTQAMPLAKP